MDGYLVRGGSSPLDQTIIIGSQLAGNTITVGNIDQNPAGGVHCRRS